MHRCSLHYVDIESVRHAAGVLHHLLDGQAWVPDAVQSTSACAAAAVVAVWGY